jgi:hypothetical protein
MKRDQFLKTSILAGSALFLLPQFSYGLGENKYTRDILIGKGSPVLKGGSHKMQPQTYDNFLRMKAAATKENIEIEVVSGYRSFERQKQIFEGKYKRFTAQGLEPVAAIEKIIEYSTIPGTSRHHWGTDIDIIDANAPRPESVLQPEHFHGKGPFCKLKEWLNSHAESFGFFEVYTDNAHRKGFKYEPWHFSFAPVSKPMLQEYKKLDLKQILLEEKIAGAKYFSEAFIKKYRTENILDINSELLS